ncbi:MAG: FxsA family protein [Actinobacteria bacterium]|nr:FxsA family protein [Actinomycetota bacterium]
MWFVVLLFILLPIAEIYVIIQVGELIGAWPTVALLILDAVVGAMLLKHQGRGAWRRFNEALAQRRFPGREVVDGVLIVIGGTLLITPGFITDVVGAFFLIPPTRAIARAVLRRFTIGRIAVVGSVGGGGFGGWSGPFGGGPGRGPEPGPGARPGGRPLRDYDFDATAEEMPSNGNGSRELPRREES